MNHEEFKLKYSQQHYLGDGVYVTFDGYNIWLSTPRDDITHTIALEPSVFDSLIEYRNQIYKDHENINKEEL